MTRKAISYKDNTKLAPLAEKLMDCKGRAKRVADTSEELLKELIKASEAKLDKIMEERKDLWDSIEQAIVDAGLAPEGYTHKHWSLELKQDEGVIMAVNDREPQPGESLADKKARIAAKLVAEMPEEILDKMDGADFGGVVVENHTITKETMRKGESIKH